MTGFNLGAMITSMFAVMVFCFGWGILCIEYNIPQALQMVGSFAIGFLGSKVIYNWLNKPDTQSDTTVEPE